jgi:uncharacterized protein YqfA (UPF0365 family)
MNQGGELGFAHGFLLGTGCGFLLLSGLLVMYLALAPWFRCFLSGAPITLVQLVGMRLRGTPVKMITDAAVALVQSGHSVSCHQVERAYLANRHRIMTMADLLEIVKKDLDKQ